MKCPKCLKNIPDNSATCPECHADLTAQDFISQETGRFAAVDPSKESYDFDLQYTLTFKDAGEIRQTIAEMDLGIGKDKKGDIFQEKKETEEKKESRHQRSLEEMEEAARRAAIRRARRTSGGKKGPKEKISRREKEKMAALRKARSQNRPSKKDIMKKRRLLFGAVVAVLVVSLIVGLISLFANMFKGEVTYPTLYTKGNQLYLYYDKKPVLLSSNFVEAYASAKTDEDKDEDESEKIVDPKRYQAATATEKQLINVSADGLYTYFVENVNLNNGRGDLVYCKNNSPKTRTLISIQTYYDFEISKDGQSVLFLRKTDDEGNHGELCYWNPELEEPVVVEGDICGGTYRFSQDGTKALYIKDFDIKEQQGDLYVRAFGKEADETAKEIDKEVSFVFGTSAKGDYLLYAKDYDLDEGTYTLYSVKDGENPTVRAENAYLPPVILEKSEGVYAYSNYEDNFQTVKYLDLAAGTGNVVADEVTQIERLRNDEMAIIYSKSYEETDKSDYYMATAQEKVSQKVANAVSNVKEDKARRVQFDISDDFSRAAYISGYGEDEYRGALMTMTIVNGYVGTEKRISDNAYGCDVSADGAVVRFAADYDKETRTVNLLAHTNSNTVTLREGVATGAFTFDEIGEIMVYAVDVVSKPVNSGNVECVTTKGRVREIQEGAESYGLKKDGRILYRLNEGEGESTSGNLYICNQKGGKRKLIDKGVNKALFY